MGISLNSIKLHVLEESPVLDTEMSKSLNPDFSILCQASSIVGLVVCLSLLYLSMPHCSDSLIFSEE